MSRTSGTDTPAAPAVTGGLRTKNLVIIGVVVAALWAMAISSGSVVFMSIVCVLTAIAAGLLFWALRMMRRQRDLGALLQGAVESPEARAAALAQLAKEKDANDPTMVFARAQLVAADDPAAALEMIEGYEIKRFPAQMQDDVALLRAQLYLSFGRAKEARPLVDRVNLDNPTRAEQRGLMVGIVAEAWARTGKHQEALALLEGVDAGAEKSDQVRMQLLAARVFARFAAGKKGGAREDLRLIADLDVNHLGRFIMPQFKVHPELQRLAREVAQKNPQMRRMAQAQQGPQRRGRAR